MAAVAIVVVAGIFLLFPRSATPPDTGQASENATPTAPTPAPVAPVPTSSAPVPAAPVQIEVTTVRRVWMRVIVDGERVVEREVPAGQQLRYSANREITVRAGDAGAVHVRVGTGEPVSLGRDGFPVTRTYR